MQFRLLDMIVMIQAQAQRILTRSASKGKFIFVYTTFIHSCEYFDEFKILTQCCTIHKASVLM